MTGSLHKLTAGDGYTYLTRQVAAHDATSRGRSALVDYYLEKGERPGVWMGRGVASLGGRIAVGDGVSEAQMKALFGQGLHPDAERIVAEAITAGVSPAKARRAAKLGYKYPEFAGAASQFVVELGRAYQEFNRAKGDAWNVPISAEVRAEIRTRVARRVFEEQYGRAPLDERELSGFVARSSRPEVKAVAGFDQTFSPVKSVSALWALADRGVAEEIEKAHEAAIADTLRWIENEVAFTRRGAGGIRQEEVTGLIATAFTHRDSRAGDPDLHTHVAISNKVQARADGAWRALDGSVLYQAEVAISERYNTALEAELVNRLGVDFEERASAGGGRPIREIVGLDPDLLAMWSTRRQHIEVRRAELAAEFRDKHGRAPTPKESIELAQQANLETREAKHEPRAEADQRRAWAAEAEQAMGSGEAVQQMMDRVLAPRAARAAAVPTASELARQVLDRVAADRARFADTHLLAEALRRVRGLGLDPDRVQEFAAEVTAACLADSATVDLSVPDPVVDPEPLRRADGRSVYERAHSRLYATIQTLQAEEAILEAARHEDGRRLTATELAGQAAGVRLNRGQAAMLQEIATSGARVQLVLAPAGSGKTTAMGAFAKAWEASGGSLVGLAPSAVAASELGGATGMHSDTMAALLTALSSGSQQARAGWEQRVGPATMVVVDEAGMASTQDLAAVIGFALQRGASVRLVGDNQQLASVQAGGVLRDLATEVGAVSLSELMRFADPAEAAATLAVRDGEHSALGFYLDRQRVHVADTGALVREVVEAWIADRQQGKDSLMLASTSRAVTELNAMARAHRLADVADRGPQVALRSGLHAGAGDVILTRRNDRTNRTSSTDWVKNGDRWMVQGVGGDGSLQVIHLASGKRTQLAADYVATQVDLGYASTIHSAQGVTTDTTHTLLTGLESRQLLYVASSRGRVANHLYLSTSGDGEQHSVLHPDHVSPLTATDVLERVLDRDGSQRSARTELREASQATRQLARAAAVYSDAVDVAVASVLGAEYMAKLDTDAETALPGVTDSPAWDALKARLARFALTAPAAEPIAAMMVAARTRDLTSAADAAAVLHWRLGVMTGDHDGPLPWLPGPPPGLVTHPRWSAYLALRANQVSGLADQVRQESLGLDDADLPKWAHTIDTDRPLVADVAVWRAARDIPDTDDSVLGAPAIDTLLVQTSADRLHRRINASQQRATPSTLGTLLTQLEPRLDDDPWLPVLLRRLGVAERAGLNVQELLQEALSAPLPDDHPAAAAWYRLAGTLAPTAALVGADTRLRPDWTTTMVELLPDGVGQRIIRDHQWPTLVAAVEAAQDAGADPATVLGTAAALLGLTRADSQVPSSDWAITLAWRVTDLVTHPDPAAPGDDNDAAPPPPEDEAPDAEVEALLAEWARQQAEQHPYTSVPGVDPASLGAPPEDLADASHEDHLHDASAPGQRDSSSTTSVGRIVELNAAAAAFYRDNYTGAPAAYVASRFCGDDLSGDPAITIGYAPAGWRSLTTHLRDQGATETELVDAGLSVYSKRGDLVDVFRDRVIVGIHDNDGHLVGFSGRAAPGADPTVPKYINTRTTDAFVKGAVLFGLPEHRDLFEAGAVPARVEGWFDAIAVTKASGGTVVGCAPLGTALTAAQAEMLTEAAGQGGVVLYAADNDRAGQAAAARDYVTLTIEGADPRTLVMIDFSDAEAVLKDPAEVYQRDAGVSLGRTLVAPHLAPGLVDQLITQRVAQDAGRISRSEVSPVVAAARDAGRLIAALPADQWDTHIGVAADVLTAAGSTHDHHSLVARETIEAAMAWEPPTGPAPTVTAPVSPEADTAADRAQELARRLAALNADGPAARAARDLAETAPSPTPAEMIPDKPRGISGPELG